MLKLSLDSLQSICLGLVPASEKRIFHKRFAEFLLNKYCLEKDKWIKIEHNPFRLFEISDDIRIRSLIARQQSGEIVQQSDQQELIYFLPTGESSEFQIWLSNDNESEFVLNSTFMGELSLNKTER